MIGDFLASLYPWTKALHVISVIAWMAGMFYLPRLFVYHVEQSGKAEGMAEVFEGMEHRLLRYIMNPAMTATWTFGLMLVFTPGLVDWSMLWPWTKAFGVIGMTVFHHWLALRRKDFVKGENRISGRAYRMLNELTTVFLVIIVFSVIMKF